MNIISALNLFKTKVLPYIEFANGLLLGCNESEKIKLQKVQNKGLKLALQRNRFYETKLFITRRQS